MFFTKRAVNIEEMKKGEMMDSFISQYSLIHQGEINSIVLKKNDSVVTTIATPSAVVQSDAELEENIQLKQKELEVLEDQQDAEVQNMLEDIEREKALHTEEVSDEVSTPSNTTTSKEEEVVSKVPDKVEESVEVKKEEVKEEVKEVVSKKEDTSSSTDDNNETERMLSEIIGEDVDVDSNDEYERLLMTNQN